MRINENEGPNGKKGKLSQMWIRPNMALGKSHFFGIEARALRWEKRREEEKKKRRRREEEKKKRREEEEEKKEKKSRFGN